MTTMINYYDYTGRGVYCPEYHTEIAPDLDTFEEWLLNMMREYGDGFESPEVYACNEWTMLDENGNPAMHRWESTSTRIDLSSLMEDLDPLVELDNT